MGRPTPPGIGQELERGAPVSEAFRLAPEQPRVAGVGNLAAIVEQHPDHLATGLADREGRIVDLGGGHGLLAQTLLILDDTSPGAIVVDKAVPPSAAKLHEALVQAWPRLEGRVEFAAMGLDDVDVHGTDLVVSCHACGNLTDVVLDKAVSVRARVAVLPCCHHLKTGDTGGLSGWVDRAAAIDIMRAVRLGRCGYRIRTQTIPMDITSKNRLLIGEPEA